MWWQQDEVVYLSQVGAHTPALVFTAPRARGLPVLLYPLVHFTTDVTVVRCYLSVIGTALLYLGLRPWLRLGYGRTVALAALLFSTLWATTFWGALVQPNLFVAEAAAAALGYALLALRAEAVRRNLAVTTLWVAAMGLLRPSDATWFVIPVVAGILLVRTVTWRRRAVVGVGLLVGLGLGWSEWVIEAFASYGGVFHRLQQANALNTPGIHFSLGAEARDINGPVLCRPCSGVPVSGWHIAWWFAIPILVTIGLLATRGTIRFLPLALATLGGTTLLAEYVLTTNYAAPRFLLPTYLLLALPCADGLGWLASWRAAATTRARVVTGIAALLVVQTVSQLMALNHSVVQATASRTRFTAAADRLRAAGVQAPCIVYGNYGPPVAFALGCNDHPSGKSAARRVRSGTTVVVLTRGPAIDYPKTQTVELKSSTAWVAHILAP